MICPTGFRAWSLPCCAIATRWKPSDNGVATTSSGSRRLFGPRDFYTPTGSLYRRLLPRLSAGHIELVLATWVKASRPSDDEEAVALDGKTVRGAATTKHKGPHLLSFSTHQSQETLLQVRVPAKTNEIPIAKMLLPCLRLHPRVYTADALHTHAPFMEVVRDCSGSSVLTVKANQPTLYADLATRRPSSLPLSATARSIDGGDGSRLARSRSVLA